MLLPKFDYHEPSTLAELCQIMKDLAGSARPLAGGTDLIVNMKRKLISPAHVVSLGRVEDLKGVGSSNGGFRIGACTTAAELAHAEIVRKRFSALGTGASSLGSPLVRNLATIGGNVVTARPAADFPPSLMAYGAEVVLMSDSGKRSLALEDFFTGPGETILEPEEILTEILLKDPPPYSGAAYLKLGFRRALEISRVSVAAFLSLAGPQGPIESARIVMGAVAPRPIRAPSAEAVLIGEPPSESLFKKAGDRASAESKPIDDFRASAQYRRAMVEVLTFRALESAVQEALGRKTT